MRKIILFLICLFIPIIVEAKEINSPVPIVKQHLTPHTLRRPGAPIEEVVFIVAHDTGNSYGARHNVRSYQRTINKIQASAHLFVDHKEIVECIPAITSRPEKAWHVLDYKPYDNLLYGVNANHYGIGVELCVTKEPYYQKAYENYIWTIAYLCHTYGLNPRIAVVGHHILDPERKTDPESGLQQMGKVYQGMLADVVKEYEELYGAYQIGK